jgi:hypothetical protein
MKRFLFTLLAMAVAVVSGVVVFVAPASASPCTPWPSCFGTTYQVTGTPDNSLWEWSNSPSLGGTAIRAIPNGWILWVGCQANNGPQEDGKYNATNVPSLTWDYAWDSNIGRFVWVYDWWMNTPPQKAAYNWYSWPDSAHHCNFAPPPPPPPSRPGSIVSVEISPGTLHVSWPAVSNASYLVSDGSTTRSTNSTSIDWTEPLNSLACFSVAAVNASGQSSWAGPTCSQTSTRPYCPQDDVSTANCTSAGAFQMSCYTTDATKCGNTPTNDFNTQWNNPLCCVTEATEATAALAYFNAAGDSHAATFFSDYLDAAGGTRTFNSLDAYNAADANGNLNFATAVDLEARTWIQKIGTYAQNFDSGYIGFPSNYDLTLWGDDFHFAVGHCYFRVSGTLTSNGWSVTLTVTEMYQFKDGQSFAGGLVTGHDLRTLQIHGLAQSFHLVGTGTLHYDMNGYPI